MVLFPDATPFLCKAHLLDTQGPLTGQKDAPEAAGSWDICLFLEPTAWGTPYSRIVSTLESCLHCFIPDIPRSLSSDMGNPLYFPESGGFLFETFCKLGLLQLSQALGWVLNPLEWPRYPRQVTLPT